MTAISSYWASVGVKTDEKGLRDVDRYLKKIEQKLQQGVGKTGLSITPKINVSAFERHLRGVLRGVGGKGSTALRVNVQVSEQGLRKSVETLLTKKNFNIPVTATLSKASLSAIRQQLQTALVGVPIHAKLSGATASRAGGKTLGTNTGANYTWSPNPSGKKGSAPHLTEWLAGRPERSSLSAANRRYSDSLINRGFFGPDGAPKTLTGFMGESILGGLGRIGSSTSVGRGLGSLGGVLGGARGGAAGLLVSAAIPAITGSIKGIWTGLAGVVTAPFKLIGGAASAVTGSFYRLALAAAPLVAGFAYINKAVQLGSQRQIALNTVSKSLGSDGKTESDWLMNMANRDGMRYNTLIDPYTTFIASASPAMGMKGAKDVFESFTQFGLTRGANDISMGLAMKAVSQMAGKGKIQAEELRGQLGDAPGFGEMQGIFAQAYQKSLGREGEKALKGQKAIEELNKAMEGGKVISSKILPHVAEIARKMAEPGLAEARGASFAEQARFANQGAKGWANFRTGGGEEGLAYFWRMMQEMGTWWENNGSGLGNYFKILMVDLNTLRVGLKEFAEFAWTGEENDFSRIMSDYGINIQETRLHIVKIFDELGNIFGGGDGVDLKTRIQNFSSKLNDILKAVGDMLANIAVFMDSARQLNTLRWQDSYKLFNPFSEESKTLRQGQMGLVNATGDVLGATKSAGGALTDILGLSNPNLTDYRKHGNGMTGYGGTAPLLNLPQTTPQQMYTPAMQSNMQQINGNVNVNVNVTGDPALAGAIDSPQAQSVIRRQVQDGLQSLLMKSVPNAPKY